MAKRDGQNIILPPEVYESLCRYIQLTLDTAKTRIAQAERLRQYPSNAIYGVALEILTQEIIKSTEIEGEFLDREQVRSSIARRLGLDISGLVYSKRNVDGIVDLMIDATEKY